MTIFMKSVFQIRWRCSVNRFAYQPCVNFVLRHRKLTLAFAFAILAATAYPFLQLGKEFMSPLNEGDILYMPTAVPGMSATEATQVRIA